MKEIRSEQLKQVSGAGYVIPGINPNSMLILAGKLNSPTLAKLALKLAPRWHW